MTVVVLAPHPDDETIGCGGTLCQEAQQGNAVVVVYLTSGELGLKQRPREEAWAIREAEAREAARVLKCREVTFLRHPDWGLSEEQAAVVADLRKVLRHHRPGRIYLPHPEDEHPDHQACWPILRESLFPGEGPAPEMLAYEVWSPMAHYDVVRDITPVWRCKLRALKCHASQLVEIDYVRAMRGLSHYRGVQAARCRHAEVFQSLSLPE